ncbi:hypothetical protein GIB67_013743 [Kingdonia uniflora]|uniref:Late embryogenesis abundant protein LEA-2 subgroup domain-containing protein n=1 Tax=Kingdonia uniflora TaxID=39325 RepID=A0A7J7NQE8_9MAGN|nr:hypothetical protein GIB67_013743 [Kingdonia uniflora]
MTSNEDRDKPVMGYPPQGQTSYNNNNSTGHPNYHNSQPTITNTAFPYSAPPPTAGNNYYIHHPYPSQPYYNPRRATFFRRIIIAAIAVLVILGTITFIMWLVLRPKLPEFRVDSASVTPFNASLGQVTGNWDIGLSVKNPNKKMNVYYDRIEASVFYDDEFLSETALAPFWQAKRNATTIRARFSAVGVYVNERSLKRIADDRSKGLVDFNLRMLAWVRFKAGAWRTRRHLMRVYCEGVKVGFSSSSGLGTLTGGANACKVDL